MPQKYFPFGRIAVFGREVFIEQIEAQLHLMSETFVAGSLLGYFSEHSPIIAGQVGTKSRQIAICIQEPGKGSSDPIRTLDASQWNVDGAKTIWKDPVKIPRIEFLGPEVEMKGLRIEEGRLVGHPDFASPQRLDVILTHELCHAYLAATKVTNVIDSMNMEGRPEGLTGGQPEAGIEEMVVCGLLAGAGLACCENAYRLEIGVPLRTSYGAVGIASDDRIVKAASTGDTRSFWDACAKSLGLRAQEGGMLAAALEVARLRSTSLVGIRTVREATSLYERPEVYPNGVLDAYDPTIEDTYRAQTMLRETPSVEAQVTARQRRKGRCTVL